MLVKIIYRAAIVSGCVLMSGCAIVSSDTNISNLRALENDLISRSGLSEGPNDVLGNSFTSVIDWAQVGGGQAGLDSSVLTVRHAPSVVSPSGGASSGFQVFGTTDSFSAEGGRDGTTYSIQGFTGNSILGRFIETQGSGSTLTGYAAYSTAGFKTSFADIVTLGRTGGTAVYRGTAVTEIFDGFGRSDVANGTSRVNVDFGANDISGSLVFSDTTDTGLGPDLGNFTLGISGGSLNGNAFSANMTADASDIGAASMASFDVTGSLYGPAGGDMGGSFATTAVADGTGEDLVLIGGFLATK